VRVDAQTHNEIKKLAESMGTTVGDTVAIAIRRLRQDKIGEQLKTPLTVSESEWLDADLG